MKVDSACRLLRPYERDCYLQERLNDKIITEFAKIGMLGCPLSRKYGGLGYSTLTYVIALERIGQNVVHFRPSF